METRMKDVGSQARGVAEDLSDRARNLGAAAWERTKQGYAVAQEKVTAGARATDRAIRTNPYQALGIAFGVGMLLGFLIKRRK